MTTDTTMNSTSRPYSPPSNVVALLKRFRSRNLPDRIDSEYLRIAGITDSLNSRTLFGLRFLGLVDGEAPTPALRSIARSTDEEYQVILQGLIREAYRDVFEVADPAQDPQSRILNVFMRYTPASQRDRMVLFFLGMCREAGIPTVDVPRERLSGASSGAKAAGAKGATSRVKRIDPAQGRGTPPRVDKNTGDNGLHPMLDGLVRSLPAPDTFFPVEKRDQWLQMVRGALAFIYKETEDQQDYEEDDT